MKCEDFIFSKKQDIDLSLYYSKFWSDAPLPCLCLDEEGNILGVNNEFGETLLYSPKDIVGEKFQSIVHPNFRKLVSDSLLLSASGSKKKVRKLRVKIKDAGGNILFVSINSNWVNIGDCRSLLFLNLADFTQERHLLERLKSEKDKYKVAFNGSKSVMLIINADTGKIEEANMAAASFYGYSRRELAEMNITDINILPSKVIKRLLYSTKTGRENFYIFRHRTANGTVKEVEEYASKVILRDRTLIFSIIHDVTNSKKNEYSFKKVEDIAEIGSWEINLNTKLVSVSEGTRSIFGLDENEEITMSRLEAFPLAEYRDDLGQSFYNMVFGEEPYDKVYKIYRPRDGKILCIRSVARYQRESNTVFGVVQDITESKTKEEELRKAKVLAEEADKIKSAFLANVSHELRTPLNSIIGLSDIIDRDMCVDEIVEMNTIINSCGHNLLDVIETILDLSMFESRRIALCKERFFIKDLLTEMNDFVQRESAMKPMLNIRYIHTERENEMSIFSDYSRILKVLKNLIKNAIKFTEQGFVDYGYYVSGGGITFYVRDTGVGIPHEKINMIFDSFRQIEESFTRKYSGIGIGLTVCKKISELLNARIWVESEEGRGSVFYFRIPGIGISYEKK